MGNKLVYDLSWDEEFAMNNPVLSFEWVAEHFRKTGLYLHRPIKFANTELISKAANHFRKYGIYTDIDPKRSPRQWREFWNREEYRRKKGIVLPIGMPASGANSDKDLFDVWIPGKMYGQLNYGPIIRTIGEGDEDVISVQDAAKAGLDQRERGVNHFDQLKALFKDIVVNETADSGVDFMDFWDGHFHYWIAQLFAEYIGLDILIFKARRKGYSYIGAWDAYDEIDMYPNRRVFLIAHDMKYLTDDGGLFDFCVKYHEHIYKHTDWLKDAGTFNESTIELSYTHPGSKISHGFQSSIQCYSAKNNPDCARGKMAHKIKWEELGSFPNFPQTREITFSAAESGGLKLGQSTYWGTAGSKDGDYAGLAHGFYNPDAYDCLPCDNIWDINRQGTKCGLFHGHYQNLLGSMDKWGNSNYIDAQEAHAKKKKRAKESKEVGQFIQWCAERATTPQEGLNAAVNNFFSIYSDRLQRRLHFLNLPQNQAAIRRCGTLESTPDGVRFITNQELKAEGKPFHPPIDDTFDTLPKNYDMHGCIVEWYPPEIETYSIGHRIYTRVPANRYIIVLDPYATDKDADDITIEHSLGAAYVYELANTRSKTKGDRLVASWIGRPALVEDYNYLLFLLAKRYNAKIGFENDRGQTIADFRKFKAEEYLLEEPEILMDPTIAGKTGRKFGVSIGKNPNRISVGARRYRERLGRVVGKNPETGEDILFVDTINCRLHTKQLMRWAKKGNWDTVSAMIAGEFFLGDIEFRLDTDTPDDTPKQADKFENFFAQFGY